jgi:putative transposase
MAFQHFQRRIKQGKDKPGFPKFKSRKAPRQSFDVPQFFKVDFNAQRVWLPKIGSVKAIFHRIFSGKPKMCTVVSTLAGKYYISIVVDDGKQVPSKPQATPNITIGIDVGLRTYITLSTGSKFANPRYLQKTIQRLRILHRRLSKKQRGSQNREKAQLRLTRAYIQPASRFSA